MAEIYQIPEGNSGMGNIPFSIPIGGFGGGLFGGNGFGNDIGGLIALAIVASIFGWNNGNGFGGFGGGNGQLGFLANQMNNDNGRDLIMQAVTSQGEASRAAIQTLSSMLGQDFNLVNSAVQNVQGALSTLAAQQGVSTLQIINSIQSGDAALSRQLCECCCENRQLTMEQGYQSQIRTIEQTNQLGAQADRNYNSMLDAINKQTIAMNDQFCALKERELQNKIDSLTANNALLRSQIDNAQQTASITGYVNSLIQPLQQEVTKIADKMPNTVPVQYPNLVAVNNTPYNGGYGFWGNGFGNSIAF